MSGFIPDASVAAAWCFSDETNPFTEMLLEAAKAGREIVVPVLWRHEIANALLFGAKRGRITKPQAVAFFEAIGKLNIILDNESWDRAIGDTWDLALKHGLTVYDAAYLELALRRHLPIATFDAALREAAQAAGASLINA